MAAGDTFLLDTAKKVVPLTVTDPDVIVYRQQVLADCLANRTVVQQMYAIASRSTGSNYGARCSSAGSIRATRN